MQTLTTVQGQPSWRIATKNVEAFVTETGGHLAPVTFDRRGRKIAPYSVAPWWNEKLDPKLPAILRVLRGDFFCMPFGHNEKPFRGQRHPVHGEVANNKWTLESSAAASETGGDASIHLSMKLKIRPGRVDKHIHLLEGHDAIYSRHVVSGMTGVTNLGHHAMLKFPDEPGSGLISTSKFVYGQVFPDVFSKPEEGDYQSLRPGAVFRRLHRVASIFGGVTDVSRYPARRGFEDLVMIVAHDKVPFAWTAVVFPKQKFVWFALKDPSVLRETVLWMSNGGRHSAPWNGRHTGVMGLEEVTSHFHSGLAESVERNAIAKKGFPTTVALNRRRPLVINYIMAVAKIPAGFDKVETIREVSPGVVALRSESRKRVEVPLDVSFLRSGEPGLHK